MAQRHKGDRKLVGSRISVAQWNELNDRAQVLGTTVSGYIADLVTAHLATTEPPGAAGNELLTRQEVSQLSKSA